MTTIKNKKEIIYDVSKANPEKRNTSKALINKKNYLDLIKASKYLPTD